MEFKFTGNQFSTSEGESDQERISTAGEKS